MGFDTFFADLDHMRMMDARHGGLVLGRGGPEDDIPMYLYAGKGFFELAGLMQGGEYLLSRAASISHGALLEEINSEKGEAKDESHAFSAFSSVINTNFMPEFGGLWIRRQQFIVNRFATQKHFATLEKINAEANWGGAKG
ncbi:hypothetical protein AOX55_00001736 [Sinorhizobium fredii CCBAU 25509]|nr:hypothetical protein AOX55_00001736 [Sinorhizobium fredii CCBAU 25509]